MERGIASFVDSVFLILISATAASILIYSASHYGAALQRQSMQLVMEYYARQTLRTIAAASVIRAGCDKPDYLLAYIKESLAKNKKLDDTTIRDVNGVVSRALKPLTGYYDYAVYLTVPSEGISQIFGICHSCSGGTCTAQDFDYTGNQADNAATVVSQSLYTYSSYAPVRIRLGAGKYAILVMRFYLWPAGYIQCPP